MIGAVALLGFFAVTRLAPRWWWAWAAAGAAALIVLLSFVFPVLVEPVFNKFTPMADGPLRTDLIALAARDGVPVRTCWSPTRRGGRPRVNAYVSGLGPTRRIVVYDTLLREAPPAEVAAVVAHELGHAKDGDVLTGTADRRARRRGRGGRGLPARLAGPACCAGPASTRSPSRGRSALLLARGRGRRPGRRAGCRTYVSRRIEARADAHALALTDDPATVRARCSAGWPRSTWPTSTRPGWST